MLPIKRQFFLLFHLGGAVFPFIAVYFREQEGFTQTQVGYAMAIAFGAVMVSPIIVTFLADTRLDSRHIIAFLFATSAASFLILGWGGLFIVILLCWAVHSMCFAAIMPLQDGMFFSVMRKKQDAGEARTPYHRIRVWGTVGFIIPSIVIYFLIKSGYSIAIVIPVAIGASVLGFINAFTIPDPRLFQNRKTKAAIPTFAAAKVLFQRRMIPFCVAIAFGHLGGATFYAFYPIYLREVVGIPAEWLGLIFNIGVAVEFFFMLSFGWLLRRMGMRMLIGIGMAVASLRMALLAFFPTVEMAILTQVCHGPYIVAMQVGPILLLNRLAGDEFRNSIQGLYNMSLHGIFRIAGSLLAGYLALTSLKLAFLVAGSIILLGALLMIVFFRNPVESFKEE